MKRTIALAAAAVLMLAGCSPGGETTPTTTPPPTLAAPTTTGPSPTPTPQWTDEQQAAIDAVQAYLEVWTDVAQNLPDSNTDRIHEVATGDLGTEVVMDLAAFRAEGVHFEGAPVFIPDRVQAGFQDGEGQRYHVHGCYDATATRWVYADGTAVTQEPSTKGRARFTVLHAASGSVGVLEENTEEGTC
jgi:hypothetical protein